MLDKLSSDGKVDIEGNKLTIFSAEKPTYSITSAVKFLAIESRESDPHKLIGRIVPSNILKDKGVEVYMDSAIYKDEAYKVEQGFAGILIEVKEDEPLTPEPLEEEIDTTEVPKSDEDLLADFFLKNM